MTATLNHNDLIKLVSWANSYAKVGTLNGYCPDFETREWADEVERLS